MAASIGQALRRSREARALRIEDVAEQTRIPLHMVEALEQEAFHVLPAPVYVRGFIRAYAGFLQLDASALIAELPAEWALRTDGGSFRNAAHAPSAPAGGAIVRRRAEAPLLPTEPSDPLRIVRRHLRRPATDLVPLGGAMRLADEGRHPPARPPAREAAPDPGNAAPNSTRRPPSVREPVSPMAATPPAREPKAPAMPRPEAQPPADKAPRSDHTDEAPLAQGETHRGRFRLGLRRRGVAPESMPSAAEAAPAKSPAPAAAATAPRPLPPTTPNPADVALVEQARAAQAASLAPREAPPVAPARRPADSGPKAPVAAAEPDPEPLEALIPLRERFRLRARSTPPAEQPEAPEQAATLPPAPPSAPAAARPPAPHATVPPLPPPPSPAAASVNAARQPTPVDREPARPSAVVEDAQSVGQALVSSHTEEDEPRLREPRRSAAQHDEATRRAADTSASSNVRGSSREEAPAVVPESDAHADRDRKDSSDLAAPNNDTPARTPAATSVTSHRRFRLGRRKAGEIPARPSSSDAPVASGAPRAQEAGPGVERKGAGTAEPAIKADTPSGPATREEASGLHVAGGDATAATVALIDDLEPKPLPDLTARRDARSSRRVRIVGTAATAAVLAATVAVGGVLAAGGSAKEAPAAEASPPGLAARDSDTAALPAQSGAAAAVPSAAGPSQTPAAATPAATATPPPAPTVAAVVPIVPDNPFSQCHTEDAQNYDCGPGPWRLVCTPLGKFLDIEGVTPRPIPAEWLGWKDVILTESLSAASMRCS